MSDCFGSGFRGVGGSIRSGRAHKPHTPRAGAPKNIRGELDKGMVFDDMREKKCVSNGWMGIWEVGHGRVSRGVLETEHGLQKTEKEREKVVVGPGSKECIAGYERNSCRESRLRWRGLVGRWEVEHSRVSRGVLQPEHGLQKREKERKNGGWTRIRRVQSWL